MTEDKRKDEKPIPDNIKEYLNDAQLVALRKIEGFGWKLVFIRRPLFLEQVAIVTNADDTSIGILEDDGTLNLEPSLETGE